MNKAHSSDVVGLPSTQQVEPSTIFRRPRVEAETGDSRSTLYLKISRGLFPRPVRLGPRSVGWPAREVAALNEARIGNATDAELRELVQDLMRARRGALEGARTTSRRNPQAGGGGQPMTGADRDLAIEVDRS